MASLLMRRGRKYIRWTNYHSLFAAPTVLLRSFCFWWERNGKRYGRDVFAPFCFLACSIAQQKYRLALQDLVLLPKRYKAGWPSIRVGLVSYLLTLYHKIIVLPFPHDFVLAHWLHRWLRRSRSRTWGRHECAIRAAWHSHRSAAKSATKWWKRSTGRNITVILYSQKAFHHENGSVQNFPLKKSLILITTKTMFPSYLCTVKHWEEARMGVRVRYSLSRRLSYAID